MLKQTIDGQPPAKDSHLADEKGHPINWDISPDGKTLYSVPMSTNQLYAYDLTADGDTIPEQFARLIGPGRKIEAINLGVSGAGMAEYTRLVRDGLHFLHPDAISL